MKRKAANRLISWKEQGTKYPLCITGPKGVGKTYLALDFAKSFFDGNLYINFETNAELCRLFERQESQSDPDTFLRIIHSYYQIPAELFPTILFLLDELCSCPAASRLFLRLYQSGSMIPALLITSSSNKLELEEGQKLEYVPLFPMDFDEFLMANGAEWYSEIIRGHSMTGKKIPDIVHRELLQLFEDYLEVGGMPAAINEYLTTESMENIAEIHTILFQRLSAYIRETVPEQDAFKMNQILDVLVIQLVKDNPKFQYRFIRKGASKGTYQIAIKQLEQNGIVYRCRKLKQKTVVDEDSFQLYFMDTGILSSILKTNKFDFPIPEERRKKVIMENFLIQALVSKGKKFYSWESKSQVRPNIIVPVEETLIPVEIHTKEHERSKSAGIFRTQYDIPYIARISSNNFIQTEGMKNYPYYAFYYL